MKSVLGRVIQYVVLLAATLFYLHALDHDPQPVQVAMLVLLALALVWLWVDALGTSAPTPRLFTDAPPASREAGQDPLTAATVRLLELHLSSRRPNRQLQVQLAGLADQRLLHVHGVRREVEPERARELLGPDLTSIIEGPAMRLNPSRIESAVRRIEEL
ncbi:hypothetical protein ASG90_17730 [Nocardioides sp. Soil797]|nr:hypothetical protein ASG90_17730 [Nocardioides sp. Soil797]